LFVSAANKKEQYCISFEKAQTKMCEYAIKISPRKSSKICIWKEDDGGENLIASPANYNYQTNTQWKGKLSKPPI